MKLIRFTGKGIRGYRDIDKEFNNDINFLVGNNGCGKTTLIRLIKGLLSFSLLDLFDIEHKMARIVFDINGTKGAVISKYTKKEEMIELSFNYSDFEEEEMYKKDEVLRLITRDNEFDLLERSRIYKLLIKKNIIPLIIGTDRIVSNDYYDYGRNDMRILYKRGLGKNYTLYTALKEISSVFEREVRKNSSKLETLVQSFKEEILKASLKFSKTSYDSHDNYNNELKEIRKKRGRLQNESIKDILGSEYLEDLFAYFDSVEECLSTLVNTNPESDEHKEALDVWKFNINSFNTVNEIINLAEKNSENVDNIKGAINRFVESANLFFAENDKEVYVSEDGEIKVRIINTKVENNIFQLSSGEQQLLIMLGHLVFNEPKVLIIDEPELSLHLAWQYHFVDALMKANPNTQYIMATHMPAIIETREDKCVELD